MEATQTFDGLRLALAAALMGLVRRRCGRRIPATYDADSLITLARDLQHEDIALSHTQGVRFAPAYPGVTCGPEVVGDGHRLVLACVALANDQEIGVAFTTLIPGHPPRVSVAPSGALIPHEWQPLEAF